MCSEGFTHMWRVINTRVVQQVLAVDSRVLVQQQGNTLYKEILEDKQKQWVWTCKTVFKWCHALLSRSSHRLLFVPTLQTRSSRCSLFFIFALPPRCYHCWFLSLLSWLTVLAASFVFMYLPLFLFDVFLPTLFQLPLALFCRRSPYLLPFSLLSSFHA